MEKSMSIETKCSCGKLFVAKDEHAGRRAKCPNCGEIVQIPQPDLTPERIFDIGKESQPPPLETRETQLLTEIKGVLESLTTIMSSGNSEASQNSGTTKQYKVLTQKDKWFSGKFDPEKLEQALNSYASQGWRLRGVATASIPGLGGAREEMVFVMER
jgi:hypothetical protein